MGRSRRRGVRGFALLLLVGAGIVVAAPTAGACSCAQIDLTSSLAGADGAFVGTYVDRDVIGEQQVAITFEVERVAKGTFGPTAIVRTNADGASCGLEFLDGPRTGLLLDRADDGVWESGLCQQVSPERLLAVAPDARPPDSGVAPIDARSGPPWWVMGIGGAVAVGLVLALVGRTRRAA
jgi:hypothetical protein